MHNNVNTTPETIIVNIKKAIFDRQSITIAGDEFSPAELQGLLDLIACSDSKPATIKTIAKGKPAKPAKPLTLGKAVMTTRSPLPILSRYAVQSGRARCTDLENLLTFTAPAGLLDGVYLDIGGALVLDKEFTLEDFPPVATPVETIPAAVFQAGGLLRVLSNALSMASTDETRYILNGVFMRRKEEDGPVEMVSTDGRRLHADELPGGAGAPFAGVVRSSAVKALIKCLSGLEPAAGVNASLVKYAEDFTGVSFAFDLSGGAVLETKEIEGTFPNFEQVIPNTAGGDWLKVLVHVNPSAWIEAFRAIEPIRKHIRKNASDIEADTVRLTLTPAGRITAVLNSCLAGFEKTEIDFDGGGAAVTWRASDKHPETGADIPSDSLTIAFNLSFLIDILKTAPDTLSLQDDLSPGLFTAAGGALSVLMPIRVS